MMHIMWGCGVLLSSIFILILLKKRQLMSNYRLFYLIGLLIGLVIGSVNIFTQKYDNYCSIYIGILCCCYTYFDKNTYSKWTNAYISSLQGYVGGVGFILYGLFTM